MAKYVETELIGPVQVLQDDQYRDAGIRGDQQVGKVLHQKAAPVMRVTSIGRDGPDPRREARPQIAQDRFGCRHQIAGQVEQQAAERLDVTREGRGPGDAEAAGLGAPRDRAEQPCLADARLTGHEQHAAAACRGVGETALHLGEEAVPADENG